MRRTSTVDRFLPRSARPGLLGTLVLIAMLAAAARSAEPDRAPRRYFPARALIAYIEYEGLDAHARAWEATAAHDLLVKTPAGSMFADLFRQLTRYRVDLPKGAELDATRAIAALEPLVRKGFACGVYAAAADDFGAILVLRGFGKFDMPGQLDRLRRFLADMDPEATTMFPGPRRIRGRDVHQFLEVDDEGKNPLHVDEPPGTSPDAPTTVLVSAWMEDDDLIVVLGNCAGRPVGETEPTATVGDRDSIAAVLDALEGKSPDVATHPGFRSAVVEGKDLKGFEPNGLYFVELKPELGGPLLLLEGVELAAELVFELMEFGLESFDDDANPPPPNAAHEAPTGPQPKKEEQLALASTERPKDRPVKAVAGDDHEKAEPAEKPRAKAADTSEAADGRSIKTVDDLNRELVEGLGLEGVKRIVGRWGFQGKALLSDVRVESAPPRKGMASLFEQPAFRTDHLPAIPPDAKDFVLASLDAGQSYRKLVETTDRIEPGCAEGYAAFEAMVKEAIGLRLREDLLRHVGPTWAIVNVPDRAGAAGDHTEAAPRHEVFVAAIDDADAFDKVAESLAGRIDELIRTSVESQRENAPRGQDTASFGVHRLPAPDRGFRFDVPSWSFQWKDGDAPSCRVRLGIKVSIYLLIGKTSIVVASDLERARHVLAAQQPSTRCWKPAGELANAIEGLPVELTFLSVSDPALCDLPEMIAGLPDTIRSVLRVLALNRDDDEEPLRILLDVIGVPRPGWPSIRIDRAKRPTVEDLRRHFFASVLATAVDDRGYRVIQREPFPFAGLASEVSCHQRWRFNWKRLGLPDMKYVFWVSSPRFD